MTLSLPSVCRGYSVMCKIRRCKLSFTLICLLHSHLSFLSLRWQYLTPTQPSRLLPLLKVLIAQAGRALAHIHSAPRTYSRCSYPLVCPTFATAARAPLSSSRVQERSGFNIYKEVPADEEWMPNSSVVQYNHGPSDGHTY